MLRVFARFLVGIGLVGMAAGYVGVLHPAGDSFAVFGGLFAALTAMALVPARMSAGQVALVVLVLGLSVGPRLLDWLPPAAGQSDALGDELVLYQKNLHFPKGDRRPLIADIRAQGADIVTLQEISGENLSVLDALAPEYPVQALCHFETYGAVAVLSRLPMDEGSETCLAGKGLAAVRLITPYGPVWAVSVHLHWPWPFQQPREVDDILAALQKLRGPRIVAGDFNMVYHSDVMARAADASNGYRPRPIWPSFHLPYLGIGVAIDHVLVPSGQVARTETRPKFASDHRGLVTRIAYPVSAWE